MAGDARTLARNGTTIALFCVALVAALACDTSAAQTMYKYRGDNGEWIYSDRPPDDGQQLETRALRPAVDRGEITVTRRFTGQSLQIRVSNELHAPVEVRIEFDRIEGVDYPHPDDKLRWVVPARSERVVLDLPVLGNNEVPDVAYRFAWLPGDPSAYHDDSVIYRAPFAAGTRHTITQAHPYVTTHGTTDERYAIDFDMPIGTDIVAARDGVVIDVDGSNFSGGPDEQRFAKLANYVRILHDDGTFAVYAHLNRSSIRVKPGDRVAAGEYIADSGNTGFSSGPHLHFAVQRNAGMRIESLPINFVDATGEPVRPETGQELTAFVP